MKNLKTLINIIVLVLLFSLQTFALDSYDDTQSQLNNENNLDKINSDKISSISSYDLGFIIQLIQSKTLKTNSDKQIEKIENEIEKIIKNINKEISYQFDEQNYEKNLRYLSSKIDINSKHDNSLAVSRDTIKVLIQENEKTFAETINEIIIGKNSFKIFFVSPFSFAFLKGLFVSKSFNFISTIPFDGRKDINNLFLSIPKALTTPNSKPIYSPSESQSCKTTSSHNLKADIFND